MKEEIKTMKEREFMNKVANDNNDFFQVFLDTLEKLRISFCIVGGLAVNAYAEPVVSLDLDIVIVTKQLGHLVSILKERYSATEYSNSINIKSPSSALRIQIQTDPRYQPFIKRAVYKTVLGYEIPVATIEDVLQGKVWAAMDKTRRASKRQKDLSDILRLIETKEELVSLLPNSLKKQLFPD